MPRQAPEADQTPRTALPTLLIKPSGQQPAFIMSLGVRKAPPLQVWLAGPEAAALAASCFLASVHDTPAKALGDMLMIYSNALHLGPARLKRICDHIARPGMPL